MRAQVNNNLIRFIARSVTEDPDILNFKTVSEAQDYTDEEYDDQELEEYDDQEPSETIEQPRTVAELVDKRYRPKIIGAKVVRAFREATPDKKASSIKVGVRIDLEGGGWWFVSRSGSWTYHFPIRQALDRYFRPLYDKNHLPVMAKEMKNRWDDVNDLKRDLGQRNPWLVIHLLRAFASAE